MENSNMKNIVVLKDLPSNIVEEAIVVLKNNKKIKKLEFIKKNSNPIKDNQIETKKSKEYIIKEAEMLISNYIKEIEKGSIKTKEQKNLQKKYNKIKKINKMLVVVSFFSILAYLIK